MTIEVEFAGIDHSPARSNRRSREERRARGNAIVSRQLAASAPSQSEEAWASIAGRLNASIALRDASASSGGSSASVALAGAPGARRSKPSQGEIDAAWSAQAHALNADAGLKTSGRRA